VFPVFNVLLDEHVEYYTFIGTGQNQISIQGYIDKGLLDPTCLYKRHHELVIEMGNRNMNHKSHIQL